MHNCFSVCKGYPQNKNYFLFYSPVKDLKDVSIISVTFIFLSDYLAACKNFCQNKMAKRTTLQWDPYVFLYFRRQISKYMTERKMFRTKILEKVKLCPSCNEGTESCNVQLYSSQSRWYMEVSSERKVPAYLPLRKNSFTHCKLDRPEDRSGRILR